MKKDLKKVRAQREAQRRKRAISDVRVISLVGYTNAGKSAIFNRLTAGGSAARNQLFSTLDTTTRKVFMPSGTEAVLTDTVGFIHKLPTAVVAAFRATLEEMDEADLLLHVVDASHRSAIQHAAVVDDLLDKLGLISIPRIMVLNKWDRFSDDPDGPLPDHVRRLMDLNPEHVLTSAELNWGIDSLREAMDLLSAAAEPETSSVASLS
jgi:GTP-binding protein HflX